MFNFEFEFLERKKGLFEIKVLKFSRINGVTPKRRLSYSHSNNSNSGSSGTPTRKLDAMQVDQTPEVLRKAVNLAEPSPQSHSERDQEMLLANKENECTSSNSSTPLCIKRKCVLNSSSNNSPLVFSSNNLNGFGGQSGTPNAPGMNDR